MFHCTQSILFAVYLQHAVDGHSLCSAPWCLPFSLLCMSITECSLHSFPLPFCPAAHTGVSRYLPQVQVFALAFIQTGCLPGEVLALIPSLQRELPLCSLQLGAVCALLKACSSLSSRLVMKRLNNIWFQCWPWEMLLIAGLLVKLQVVELSLNQIMTLSRFSNPFLDLLQSCMFIPMLMWW